MNDSIFGRSIYLDANVFIYLLEGYPEFSVVLGRLFDLIDAKKIQAITSELTLAETLVKPMADKNLALQKIYENTLKTSAGLQVLPITQKILMMAAQLRAEKLTHPNAIRLPDAIHIATAHLHQCDTLLTNDKRLKTASNIEILLISEIS